MKAKIISNPTVTVIHVIDEYGHLIGLMLVTGKNQSKRDKNAAKIVERFNQ